MAAEEGVGEEEVVAEEGADEVEDRSFNHQNGDSI
jgi:hypothetical protein